MGAEAKRYLQEHSIPQLFEGLMTGLIYNRPDDPLQFLEGALAKVRQNPGIPLKWDSFVEATAEGKSGIVMAMRKKGPGGSATAADSRQKEEETAAEDDKAKPRVSATASSSKPTRDSSQPASRRSPQQNGRSRQSSHSTEKGGGASSNSRPSSLAQAASNVHIAPDAPIILFMGGPGGGKTRYAAQLQEQLRAEGLVHICMPDLVRTAIARYKDKLPEWRLAAERYQRGELIPNELAQQLVKVEMGRHPQARAYFLEGFPREARQVEDFERNVRQVDMALILDYDEEVLRRHMQSRGLLPEVVDRRIAEFKQKTLPSAKYFDDQRLLHLIPGEKDDAIIIERMKKLALRAMRAGVQKGSAQTRLRNGSSGGGGASTSASSAGPASAQQNGVADQPPPLAEEATQQLDENSKRLDSKSQVSPMEAAVANHNMDASSQKSAAERAGSAGKGSKTPSKPQSASTAKSKSSGPASAATPPPRADSAGIVQRELDAMPPQRPASGSAKKGSGSAGSSGSRAGQRRENGGGPGSREGSAKSKQGGSSTVSTPKPSEGPFRELLANSAGPPPPPARDTQAEPDPFPKGLPSEAPVILIIGAPGSNKFKFAQQITRKYDGFVHLSMGELFRRKVLQNGEDELWNRIGKKMDAGETIPTRICRELLYMALHERGQNGWGYVIEGYPRTLPQAEDIEAQLGRLDLAILIDCTEQFCRDSLRRRYQKDKEEGAERPDDDEAVVRVRLSLFKQNTLPMLKHLDDNGLLRVVRSEEEGEMHQQQQIEGDSNEEKVFQEICSIIDNTIFIQDEGEGNGKSLNSSKQNSIEEAADDKEQARTSASKQ